jgi:hypothetical protein
MVDDGGAYRGASGIGRVIANAALFLASDETA